MIYKKTRKPNFRFTESKHYSGKKACCLVTILVSGLMLALTVRADSSNNRETIDTLKAIAAEQFEQEVAQTAHSQQWQDYQLNYRIWVPRSAKHLTKCSAQLTFTSQDHQVLPVGHLKRMLSCNTADFSWRINITIKANITLDVVVAANTINKGQQLRASHLKKARKTFSNQSNFYTQTEALIGLETTRQIRLGQPIHSSVLTSPALVNKGNEVLIIASQDGLIASTKGIALEKGKENQQIKVKNLQSGKIIRALVTGLNQVHTQF